MARSPFLVGVSDLAPGDQRTEHIETPVDWSVDMNRVLPEPPLVADLTISRMSGGIAVHGRVAVSVRSTCRRCLDEFDETYDIATSAMFMLEPDDDAYLLTGEELDLTQMLRDDVLLSLPAAPDCGPDCPGVVSSSGADLNTLPEDESEDRSGSPFDVLRGFFDPDS